MATAADTRGVPATRLAGLEKFAGEVFANSQGKYTLDDYDYFDDTSLFSTGAFTVTGNGLAVQQIGIFNAAVGTNATAQGFPATFNTNGIMTYAETNLQRGQAGGKFPQNQAYVAVAGGFDLYCVPTTTSGGTTYQQQGGIPVPNASDAFQIISSLTWQWNVGGNQSPTLFYEPIKAWPTGFGLFGIGATGTTQAVQNGGPVSAMRKFAFPLMFPPNTAAELLLSIRRPVTDLISLNNGSLVLCAMHLRGYMLSKVR